MNSVLLGVLFWGVIGALAGVLVGHFMRLPQATTRDRTHADRCRELQ